ncbi:uncharacterized protein RAG0_04769 [Rhynchosporium agropyri]|uniref:Uncharacterized protein n=1 Tax=Rhynchosporium agropyri TaxID=914238 RepID=A0A1E1KA70_9HELO|nr:uncharacterized protein RAG0_04769 [Rhynchosporium agropyri]
MSLKTLLILLISLSLASSSSAQQPTPFIPATHTGYSLSSSSSSTSKPPGTAPTTPPAPHFYPIIAATFRYPNQNIKTATNTNNAGAGAGDASSVWQALSSIQATWTAGTAYAKITAAVYQAAPESARSSLSVSGYNWDDVVAQPWYDDVDTTTQDQVKAQEEVLQETFDSMVSETKAVSGGGTIRNTDRLGIGMGLLGALVVAALIL